MSLRGATLSDSEGERRSNLLVMAEIVRNESVVRWERSVRQCAYSRRDGIHSRSEKIASTCSAGLAMTWREYVDV